MNISPLVRALVVLPVPTESTPLSARVGLYLRAQATLTGRCHCGGIRVGATLEHEDCCPAIGAAVERAVTDGKVDWVAVKALMPAALLLHAST